MLSFQIKEEISKILASFQEAQYFFESLNNIDSTFPDLEGYIQAIAEGGDKSAQAVNQLRSHLAHVRGKISDVRPRSFFSSIEKLQSEIIQAKEYELNDLSQLNEIEEKLNSFSHTYEAYIDSYSPQSAGAMIVEARSLSALLNGFKKGLMFYLENIESSATDFEDGRELSIVLSSSMTLSEFIFKLQSIENIYDELCMLINVSKSEHPIQILKIESGSLWAKIFGESKVIGLMTSFIESGAGFVYRNYTAEGKLSAIPRKVEAVESILKLSEQLKNQGINTEKINEHIRKSSVVIAKELNKLISGEPEIIINSTKLSIGEEVQKKLIESNAILKLELDEIE